jgi:hypothetical protein
VDLFQRINGGYDAKHKSSIKELRKLCTDSADGIFTVSTVLAQKLLVPNNNVHLSGGQNVE